MTKVLRVLRGETEVDSSIRRVMLNQDNGTFHKVSSFPGTITFSVVSSSLLGFGLSCKYFK